jgi:hypothetical protein
MNKVFVALCSVAFFWSASVLMRLFAVRPIADCLAAALLASSYLQFCRTNFIKNFVGLIFLTLLLRQILQPLQSSSNIILNKRWFLLTASVFLGSVVSHTQTAFVAIFILLVFSYFIVRGHVTTERQRILSIFTATVLSLVLLLLIYKNRARINAVTWGNLFVFDAVFPLQILKLNGNSHPLGVEAMALMALNMLFLTRYVWRALWLKTAPATDTLVVLLIVCNSKPVLCRCRSAMGFSPAPDFDSADSPCDCSATTTLHTESTSPLGVFLCLCTFSGFHHYVLFSAIAQHADQPYRLR